MENETLTVGTATGIKTLSYNEWGSWRLPCGICQRTNSICPMSGGWNINPTWTIKTDSITTGTIDAETAGQLKTKVKGK